MPPAPTKPMMVDARTLMSQRYVATPTNAGLICGTMPYIAASRELAPVALMASTWPRSISSIASASSFEQKPIERTPTARTPASAQAP